MPTKSSMTPLRAGDLICRQCFVEATSEEGGVCQLCRALGKGVDPVPKEGVWSNIRLVGARAKRFVFGLNA